jgi:hypothetical protein
VTGRACDVRSRMQCVPLPVDSGDTDVPGDAGPGLTVHGLRARSGRARRAGSPDPPGTPPALASGYHPSLPRSSPSLPVEASVPRSGPRIGAGGRDSVPWTC